MTTADTSWTGGYSARIISLFGGTPPVARPATFPAIASVEAYWEALRAGRPLPNRADFRPDGLGQALRHVFLLDRLAPGVMKLRVAGGHLADLMGMDVNGMPISALAEPVARDALADLVDDALARPAMVRATLNFSRGIGKPTLEGALWLAPIAAGARGTRLLGCLEARGKIGRAPRRFTIGNVALRQIRDDFRQTDMPASGTVRANRPERTDRPALRLVTCD